MPQYNFYIDEELKERVEKIFADSGISGKPKFLDSMVRVYQSYLASKSDIEIDISAYQNTNQESKEVIQKAFTHILTTLDYNFSTLQQEKIYIEKQKQKLNTRNEEIEQEVQKVKLKAYEEIKELNSQYELEKDSLIQENKKVLQENKELNSLLKKSQEELKSMTSIANQTGSIMQENKELRDSRIEIEKKYSLEIDRVKNRYDNEIEKLKETHRNLEDKYSSKLDLLQNSYDNLQKKMSDKERELFEVTHAFTRCKEDVKKYQIQAEKEQIKLDKKHKELEDTKSKYNQLLGKVEILEKLEKEYHEMDDRRRANKDS